MGSDQQELGFPQETLTRTRISPFQAARVSRKAMVCRADASFIGSSTNLVRGGDPLREDPMGHMRMLKAHWRTFPL